MLLVLAGQPVHVRGRAAEVGNGAGEALGLVADFLDLAQDRRLGTALDDAALVLGDRAEGAAAEAAAHDVDRETDHFPGRNVRVAVARMRAARIRQAVHAVHLVHRQRQRLRIEPDIALAVRLHQRPRIAGVRFQMQYPRRVRVQHRIGADLLIRRQPDHGLAALLLLRGLALFARQDQDRFLDHCRGGVGCRAGAGRLLRQLRIRADERLDLARGIDPGRIGLNPVVRGQPAARHHERGAAQVADRLDRLACRQAVREVDQRPFRIAVQQDIGLGIRQHRTLDLVAPVIVMRDAAQAGLDAADHDGGVRIGFARALRIHHHRAVGPLVRFGIRGVRVFGADLAVGGIPVDHRIHVAGRDAEIQLRLAQHAKCIGRQPVRLADDADPEALRLQQAPDQRHAEARMIDIRVAGDQDHIAAVPAELVHLGARHRQEWGGRSPFRALLHVGKQVGRGLVGGDSECFHIGRIVPEKSPASRMDCLNIRQSDRTPNNAAAAHGRDCSRRRPRARS